jgi:hypothetical protein
MNTAFILLFLPALVSTATAARTYHIDAKAGNDRNTGLAPDQAWQSLAPASRTTYRAGDRLLLKRGGVFPGTLTLTATGSATAPVIVDAYGDGPAPHIDAKGCVAGLAIAGSRFLEVSNLEISADGGTPQTPSAANSRFGVNLTIVDGDYQHIVLRGLHVHDIFAAQADPGGDMTKAPKIGFGINVTTGENGRLRGLVIENCRIERTAATGIMIRGGRGPGFALSDIKILNNRLTDIGGPGMNPMLVTRLLVRGNVVDRSGSLADPRMRGRGSGIWPWGSEDVLIEKNTFMHARGINDSCGAHIDFNCRNVVIQYNISIDNEGGFVEILGNNFNCCYRYNISINDGARVKGAEWKHADGSTLKAQLDGKTIFLSSFTGNEGRRHGPYNSYIYNNTVFVRADMHSVFNITRVSDGALIANNIFYILGPTRKASDEEGRVRLPPEAAVKNIVIANNLYARAQTLPDGLPIQDGQPLRDRHELVANPQFKRPGGFDPADYVPANRAAVKDQGIRLERLPGDQVGVHLGLDVKADFFGHPITGLPDLGAIELP